MLPERIVLILRIDQRLHAADCTDHAFQLAAAHALIRQVDPLKLHPALLEKALGLFGIKAFGFPENLNIHLHSLPISAQDHFFFKPRAICERG